MKDGVDVPVAEIPLPPEDRREGFNEPAPEEAPAEMPPAAPAVVELEFVDADRRRRDVPLDHPFRHEGKVVRSITLHRLTTAAVGELVDSLPNRFDRYDIYAAMCGLPAAVLRGLDGDDGARLGEAGHDFLPHAFRGDGS